MRFKKFNKLCPKPTPNSYAQRVGSQPAASFRHCYVTKTAGSNDEHHYPDPDGFVVDTPMGRYTGVREMIEMSKTPGEYKYPLTPLGSWQPSWL